MEDRDFKKGDIVRLKQGVQTMDRNAPIERQKDVFFLHKGEIFHCTDHSQPAFMSYLNVWSDIRKRHFTLPMAIVEHV